jgi:hypothetical protein
MICIACGIGTTETKEKAAIFYGSGTQLLVYMFLYKSIRNLNCYLMWCFFGIIHLVLYAIISVGTAGVLKNTIVLMVFIQMLRYLSLKWQYREFIMPERNLGSSRKRKDSEIDFLLFVLYMVSFYGLNFLAMKYA